MTSLLAGSLLYLSLGQPAVQQEAILHDGRRLTGSLTWHPGGLHFSAGKKTLSLGDLHSIRLSDDMCPLARVPLMQQISFDVDQAIAGQLVEVTADKVKFRMFSGQEVEIDRHRVRGLGQPEGWQLVAHEDFEADSPEWKFAGAGMPAYGEPFSGKRSLHFTRPGHKAFVKTQQALGDGRLLFFFRREAKTSDVRVRATFRRDKEVHTARLALGAEFVVPGQAASLPASPGWHQVRIDFGSGSVRTALDNHVLATEATDRKAVFEGIAFELAAEGSCLLDNVMLLRPGRLAKLPEGLPDVDTVCLADGDRLFGKIARADGKTVVVDARFGTRTYSWFDVQQIVWKASAPGKPSKGGVAVWLTPSPGFAPQRLLVRVVGLEKNRLSLEHEVLGRIQVELANCRRIDVINATSPRSLVGSREQ